MVFYFIFFFLFVLCVRQTGWEESELWEGNIQKGMALMELGESYSNQDRLVLFYPCM